VWTEPPFLGVIEQGGGGAAATRLAQRRYVEALRKWFASKGRQLSPLEESKAVDRWRQRVTEWTSPANDEIAKLLGRARDAEAKGGVTTVEWQIEGNSENLALKNENYDVNFKVDEHTTDPTLDPFGPRKRYVPYANSKAGGPLTRIRSDHDALFFAYENGAPLEEADRLAVYKYLREQGVLEHPDTGTYMNASVRNAILQDGTPTFIRNANGEWTIGRYNAKQSGYLDPGNNRQYFDGAQYVSPAP
jgi:hypothetical protein